jgi:hypothetical protein
MQYDVHNLTVHSVANLDESTCVEKVDKRNSDEEDEAEAATGELSDLLEVQLLLAICNRVFPYKRLDLIHF